jgi:hypothetical protein
LPSAFATFLAVRLWIVIVTFIAVSPVARTSRKSD